MGRTIRFSTSSPARGLAYHEGDAQYGRISPLRQRRGSKSDHGDGGGQEAELYARDPRGHADLAAFCCWAAGRPICMAAGNGLAVNDEDDLSRPEGVKIDGIGTTTLKIKGVKNIRKNITYSPAEDPLEAMTFIAAAVTTNSSITMKRVPAPPKSSSH